jgi:hypothetical protein
MEMSLHFPYSILYQYLIALGEPRCWIGIFDKFWDLRQNKSKNKRKLEYGPKRVMEVDFKESNHAIGGITME